MKRISQFVAFVVVGLAGLTGTAFAHAEFDPATAVAGSGATLNISVPNEHSTANTIKVELLIPVECAQCVIKPLAPTGWVAQYANSTITWTGGKITGTDRVAFSFTVEALPAEGKLVFKALQTYDNSEVVRWVEPPLADGSEPAHPAPELTLTPGTAPVSSTTTAITPDASTTAAVSTTVLPAVSKTQAITTTNATTTNAPTTKKSDDSNTGTIVAICVAIGVVIGAGLVFVKAKRAKR